MKKIKKIRGSILITLIATLSVLVFNACYVDYGMTVQEYDVITTLYDPEYDFTKDKIYLQPAVAQRCQLFCEVPALRA